MLYLGALAVIFATYLVWREYSSYLDGQLAACRSFLNALCDFSEKMRCYLNSPREWAREYSDERIQGFLDGVRNGESFAEAYSKEKRRGCLTPRADDAMTACFSRMGEGDLDGEVRTVESAIVKLRAEESALSEELAKKCKVAGAILGACASGIVILVI